MPGNEGQGSATVVVSTVCHVSPWFNEDRIGDGMVISIAVRAKLAAETGSESIQVFSVCGLPRKP